MRRLIVLVLCFVLLAGCTTPATTGKSDKEATESTIPAFGQPLGPESEDPQQRLTYRRDRVEQYMRHMMSVRWKIDNAVSYSNSNTSLGLEADAKENERNVINLLPNQIYQGIPYTHGGGSGYSFLALATRQDEHGVYILEGLTRELLSGYSGRDLYNSSRLGNDCADAVFWAWAQVSSTISFPYTNCMIGSYGCLRVGSYDCPEIPYTGNTSVITGQNGQQRMFEAYAQLQKADALVRTSNSAGHAVMAVRVYVERDDQGLIDGEKSYITILEQDVNCEVDTERYFDEAIGQTVYLCEKLDQHRTFQYLYDVGYLPVTCKELIDPAPLADVILDDCVETADKTNLFTGTIRASYRIASVTVTITDSEGALAQKAVCFGLQEDMYTLDLRRFVSEAEQRVLLGRIDLDTLTPGSYRCTFTCRLSNGMNLTFRDFALEV